MTALLLAMTVQHLYDWWAPINALMHSSKSCKGMRTSRRRQNMHFRYITGGGFEGRRTPQHQSDCSLGMQLHVWSNIWPPFNQVAVPAAAPAAVGDKGEINWRRARGCNRVSTPMRVWFIHQAASMQSRNTPSDSLVKLVECSQKTSVMWSDRIDFFWMITFKVLST